LAKNNTKARLVNGQAIVIWNLAAGGEGHSPIWLLQLQQDK
jgi:hypothetical protein